MHSWKIFINMFPLKSVNFWTCCERTRDGETLDMKSREDDSAYSGRNVEHENRNLFDRSIYKNYNEKVSWHAVYFLISVLFITQIMSFYYLYVCYINLDSKYEIRFKEQNDIMSSHDVVLRRAKRDLGIKDNSIMKPATDEIKIDTDTEGAKNESTLTIEEIIHFNKQNFSAEDWVWLNKYSRVPVIFLMYLTFRKINTSGQTKHNMTFLRSWK